jgi:hypothetical protein
MKKMTILLIFLIMFSVGCFSGCIESNDNNELDIFVGQWNPTIISGKLIFNSNRTCIIGGFSGVYKIEHETLVVYFDEGVTTRYDYEFSNNNTTLALTELVGNFTIVYEKQ